MNTTVQERIVLTLASLCAIISLMYVTISSVGSKTAASRAALSSPLASAGASAAPVASAQPGGPATQAPPTPAPQAQPGAKAGAPGAAPPPAAGPVNPGAAAPPADGTYRYREKRGDASNDRATIIKTVGRSGSEVKQTEEQAEGTGRQTVEVSWKPEAKLVTKAVFGSGAQSADCTWNPPIMEYKLPLAKGVEWTVDSTCTITPAPGQTAELRVKNRSRVTGAERVLVGTQQVDCWVIESVGSVTTSSGGQGFTGESTERQHFAPKLGLVAKVNRIEKQTGSGGGTREVTVTRELLSTTPS